MVSVIPLCPKTQRSRCLPTVYRSGSVVESVAPVRQLAQCQAVTHRIQLSVFSELLVKLEISLTLSGEIDNSNVKEVEEVSA